MLFHGMACVMCWGPAGLWSGAGRREGISVNLWSGAVGRGGIGVSNGSCGAGLGAGRCDRRVARHAGVTVGKVDHSAADAALVERGVVGGWAIGVSGFGATPFVVCLMFMVMWFSSAALFWKASRTNPQ